MMKHITTLHWTWDYEQKEDTGTCIFELLLFFTN